MMPGRRKNVSQHRKNRMTRKEIRDHLSLICHFAEATAPWMSALVEAVTQKFYDRDHVIVRKGDPGRALYFIVSGACEGAMAERARLIDTPI